MNSSNFDAAAFLYALGTLPAKAPRPGLLLGISSLTAACGGGRPAPQVPPVLSSALPVDRAGPLGARLNRRYLRIRTVQDELGKLDFEKARPGATLDDFVFEQTDFSVYKKINAGEFSLFNAGLEDYDDDFYTGTFRMDRGKTGALINSVYRRIGAFYYLNRKKHLHNPLLMAVMRTLHTSLVFRPLVTGEELMGEFTGIVRYLAANKVIDEKIFFPALQNFNAVYRDFLKLLDGSAVLHADGMVTTLAAEQVTEAAFPGGGKIALKGIFHPRNKAYTMRLT
ncbi:MAG: hypothetical protein LBF77_06440 [Spirochaetaceae bacterium]|jgi:hypothetical protein|nr:hypothetical protein [Spirochaetaceae bacterium]